jgi:hypothetical protein
MEPSNVIPWYTATRAKVWGVPAETQDVGYKMCGRDDMLWEVRLTKTGKRRWVCVGRYNWSSERA